MGSAVVNSACGLLAWIDKEGTYIGKGAGWKNHPAKADISLFYSLIISMYISSASVLCLPYHSRLIGNIIGTFLG
jgi:hypothetical protein